MEKGVGFGRKKEPPYGYALPGGFVDYGEPVYNAAVREAKEETGLNIRLVKQLFTYSHPKRDPRQHVVSIVFVSYAVGNPKADDDAKEIIWVPWNERYSWISKNRNNIVCDHFYILEDYLYDKIDNKNIVPDIENHRWK